MPLPPICAPQHPSFAPSVLAFLRRAQISSDLCRFTGTENPEESEPKSELDLDFEICTFAQVVRVSSSSVEILASTYT